MKIGDKAQFTAKASTRLKCIHGSAAVLTVTGLAAGVVFLRQDWTRSEFMADEDEVCVMAIDDAEIQTMIYQAHLDEVRNKRLAK